MARRTAQDFVNEVRDIAGGETSETLSDTRILRYVNESIKAYSAKHMFPQIQAEETITTADGTAAYELTTETILQVDSVEDTTNRYNLHPISDYQYRQYTQGNASNTKGTPIEYFVSGVGANNRWEITFFPTPAGVYTLELTYYGHTDLVLSPSATSPIIPTAFDDAVVLRAVAMALRQGRDVDGAWKMTLAANDAEKFAMGTAHLDSWRPIRARSIIADAVR